MNYRWFVIVLHAIFYQYVDNQEITFLPLEQADSRSKCITAGDLVVIKSIANFSGLNINHSFISVTYEIEKITPKDNIFLFEHDLKERCKNGKKDTYMCHTIEREVVLFTLSFRADQYHNKANIIGKLNIDSTAIRAAVHDFPDIIDTTNVTGELRINKNITSPNNGSKINITVSDLNVQFDCKHHIKPCLIEMTINEARSIKGFNQVRFKETVRNNGSVYRMAIKYAACRMDRGFKLFKCIITADTDYSSLDLTHWENGAFIFAVVILLTSIGVYYFYCNYRLETHASKQRNQELLLPCESDVTNSININRGNHKAQRDNSQSFLHKFYTGCKKDSSHKDFIALQDLEVNDVPQNDQNVFDFIYLTAKLTVRLAVSCNSPFRPKEFINPPEPSSPEFPRIGTGLVSEVLIYHTKKGDYNIPCCSCQKCTNSNKPSENWGILKVTTAKFIVYDDTEAEETKCRFYFESKRSPLLTLEGWKIESSSKEEDRCIIKLQTCDSDLLDRLNNALKSWNKKRKDIDKQYARSKDDHKCTFMVSHPHGCPMYVTIGRYINRTESSSNSRHTSYTYTTSTCDGCVGAYVHFLGVNVETTHGSHIHGGRNESGFNYCGIGHEIDF